MQIRGENQERREEKNLIGTSVLLLVRRVIKKQRGAAGTISKWRGCFTMAEPEVVMMTGDGVEAIVRVVC